MNEGIIALKDIYLFWSQDLNSRSYIYHALILSTELNSEEHTRIFYKLIFFMSLLNRSIAYTCDFLDLFFTKNYKCPYLIHVWEVHIRY